MLLGSSWGLWGAVARFFGVLRTVGESLAARERERAAREAGGERVTIACLDLAQPCSSSSSAFGPSSNTFAYECLKLTLNPF